MATTDKWDKDVDVYVDYYLLESGEVGRVTYDSVTGEYLGGELMSKTGQWCKYAVNLILRESILLSPEEADKYTRHVCEQAQE